MPLPKRNSKLPDLDEMNVNEQEKIRETDRWRKLYTRLLDSKKAMRGSAKDKEEAYCQMIDKLYNQPPVKQNNIMASTKGFMNENFKFENTPEEIELIKEAQEKRRLREIAEGLRDE